MGLLGKVLSTGLALLSLTSGASAQAAAEVARGLGWLQAQILTDGSIAIAPGSIATPVQTSTEVTLSVASVLDAAAVPIALTGKLAPEADDPTEYLARKAIALRGVAGSSFDPALSLLATRQAPDGGFAPAPGHASTVLDTVWACAALSGSARFTGAGGARTYLLANVQPDGGLAGGSREQRIQNSALGVLALQFAATDLSALSATRRLVQWLQSVQQSDGSWAGSPYLTAVALYAVSAQGGDSAIRANARSYLLAQQRADGSWGGDAFLTAVVLRTIATDPGSTPQKSSLSGFVTDAVSGTLLSGTQVSLSGTTPTSMKTDSDANGRFTFAMLAAGAYTVQFVKAGFKTVSRSLSLEYGQTLDAGSIAMVQEATLGIVKGQVVAAATGLPIAGTPVVLSGSVTLTTTTDAQGSFEFTNVPPGAVSIAVSQAGFLTASATGNLSAGQTLVFSASLYAQGTPDVPTTGRLIGKVVAAGTGDPLRGVAVELNGAAGGVSGSDGRFDLTLGPQAYALRIAQNGYDPVTANFLLSAGAVVDAGTLALPAQRTTSSITGRVTDQTTGMPIAGAYVGLVGTTPLLSGADGSFSLSNLMGTAFDVRVLADNHLAQTWRIQVDRPSVIRQDFPLSPQPLAALDLKDLNVQPSSASSQSPIGMTATVVNSGATAKQLVLVMQVVDQDGKVVATGSSFTADAANLLGTFDLAAAQERAVLFKWNTGQFAPGAYRLVGMVVEAGTITQDNPVGRVLATRSASLVIAASIRFIGGATADPPVLRANTSAVVKLSALVQNNGNVDLPAQNYRLQVIDEKTSAIVASSEAAGAVLQPNQLGTLAFTDWTPTNGGNFSLKVDVPGAAEQGQLVGKLYVGDATTATYTVNKSAVPAGNQTVRASVLISGQDSTTGTISDPLAVPIKTAIQKATAYNDLDASNWVAGNRCLGCHVVTQALVGGELTRRLTTFNKTQRNTLFNSLSTYRQASGALQTSNPEYSATQTMLGLWALNAWHKKDELAATLAAAADFILGKQEAQGSWTADYPYGWWVSRPTHTAFNLKSLTEVVDTLRRVPHPLAYSSQAWKEGNGLNGAYYLEKASSGDVLVSNANAGTVTSIGADGAVRTLVSGLTNPAGLLQAADGNLYIATASGIHKRAPDGTLSVFSSLAEANALAQGPDGVLYASESGTAAVYKLSSSGEISTHLSGGALSGPAGLVFDADGNLIVANYSGGNIVRIKPDKSTETVVTWTNGSPRSIVPYQGGWLVGTSMGAYRYNADWQGERVSFTASDGLVVLADGTIVSSDGGSTVSKLLPVPIDSTAKIAAYGSAIGKATDWLMDDRNVNASSNLELAHRLIGLGSANRFLDGTARADSTRSKMEQVATLLRARQRSDGGWGRLATSGSDSMVTAQVGFALDYLHPSASDPVVQNAIKFLLARQQADGSWQSENGILSTRLAATTWVEIWLPIALDRVGGIDTDVTLRFAPNVSMSKPSLAPTVTSNNVDGSITHKWQLTGVTSASRNIQFDLELLDMQLGEARPASVEAFMTFRNTFTDGVVHAPIQSPVVSASAFLGIGVATDRADYGANTPVAITGRVSNLGVTPAGGSVEFSIQALDSAVIATTGRASFADLAEGASTPVPSLWETGRTYVGQYFVEARLYDSAGRFVAATRSAFVISPGKDNSAATLASSVRTDKLSYAATETVRLTGRITNPAVNQNAADLQVETTLLNIDGTVRWTATAPLQELAAGALRDLNYSVPLNSAPSGTYTVRVVVKDRSAAIVAADSKTFTVQSTAVTGAGITGTIQAAPRQVPLGDAVVLTFGITNNGNDELANLPLTVNLVDPAQQKLVATFGYSPSIPVAGHYAGSANSTSTGPTGTTYVAVLSATVGNKTLTLAQDSFTVVPPAIKLDVGQVLAHGSRVLVLVSCDDESDGHDSDRKHDDHDPHDEPDQQRAYEPQCARGQAIDRVLAALGVTHTIVAKEDSFRQALRSGLYNTYWISGKQDKLHDDLAAEVREAVHGGDGLILDGVHDERNKKLDAAAGILYRGKIGETNLPVDIAGPDFDAQQLQTVGRAQKIELAGGTQQAVLAGARRMTYGPAIVTHPYGAGRAVLFACDVVESLQAQAAWQPVLSSGLRYVLPTQTTDLAPGSLLQLKTSVHNLAKAADVYVRSQLPSTATVIDFNPGGSRDSQTGAVEWTFPLAESQSEDLSLTLQVPAEAGDYTLHTQILTGSNGARTPYGDPLRLPFKVTAAAQTGGAVRQALQALIFKQRKDQMTRDKVLGELQQGLAHMNLNTAAGYEAAIGELIRTIDLLGELPVDASSIHLGLDRLLREAQWRWAQVASPSDGYQSRQRYRDGSPDGGHDADAAHGGTKR